MVRCGTYLAVGAHAAAGQDVEALAEALEKGSEGLFLLSIRHKCLEVDPDGKSQQPKAQMIATEIEIKAS